MAAPHGMNVVFDDFIANQSVPNAAIPLFPAFAAQMIHGLDRVEIRVVIGIVPPGNFGVAVAFV